MIQTYAAQVKMDEARTVMHDCIALLKAQLAEAKSRLTVSTGDLTTLPAPTPNLMLHLGLSSLPRVPPAPQYALNPARHHVLAETPPAPPSLYSIRTQVPKPLQKEQKDISKPIAKDPQDFIDFTEGPSRNTESRPENPSSIKC